MENKRPFLITILGWFYVLGSIASFLIVLFFAFSKISVEKIGFIMERCSDKPLSPVLWIGFIFLGKGLLNLREWARIITVWSNAAGAFVIFIAVLINIEKYINIANALTFLVTLLLIYYLTRPEIKEQFK